MSDSSDVDTQDSKTARSTVGCVGWSVALLGIGALIVLLLPTIQSRPGGGRAHCKANLKNIGLALLNYEDAFDHFPPAYAAHEQGQPMQSWRVRILPFMEYQDRYEAYDLDQPWDSEHNLASSDPTPPIYRCWNDSETGEHDTSYVMVVGDGAITDGPNAVGLKEFEDEMASTMLVAEMHNSGIHWMEPRDLDLAKMSLKFNDPKRTGLRSEHAGGIQAAFADGSVHFLSDAIDPRILRALITTSGGETVTPEDLEPWTKR